MDRSARPAGASSGGSEGIDAYGTAKPPGARREALREVRWWWLPAGLVVAYLIGVASALPVKALGWWESGGAWEREALRLAHATVSPALDVLMLTLPLFGTNYTLVPVVVFAALWLWRPPGRIVPAFLLALLGSVLCAGAAQAVSVFLLGHPADRLLLATLGVVGAAIAYALDRRHLERPGRPVLAMHLVMAQLGSWLLNPAIKFSVPRPRPTLFEQRGQHGFPAFPSGHSIAVTAVMLTAAWLIDRSGHGRWGYWVVAAFWLLNSWSRIYLSVHWPTDVIAGTLVGLIWLLAVLAAFRPAHDAARPPRQPPW